VTDRKGPYEPGWCTYTYEAGDAPELEVFCGGINHKAARASAVWRQGNLLHFGFEPSPERMSAAGQALLVNAICYIARFTEDRPVVRTPCVFVSGKRIFDRGVVDRLLADPGRDLKDLQYYLAKEADASVAGKGRSEVRTWYRDVGGYLRADADGRLTVDADARAFGVPPADQDFLGRAVAALGRGDHAELARRLLARYAPDGPGAQAPAARWHAWLQRTRPYQFFSDLGGYRWYLDPLAKRRGIPTAQLRGPARATRPAVAARTVR
jgi:hypothetical protein